MPRRCVAGAYLRKKRERSSDALTQEEMACNWPSFSIRVETRKCHPFVGARAINPDQVAAIASKITSIGKTQQVNIRSFIIRRIDK